jgi:hypothetical protein
MGNGFHAVADEEVKDGDVLAKGGCLIEFDAENTG